MLASRYSAASFDRQLYLADIIDESDWHLDMAAGLLSFGGRHRWHIQVLGTELESAQTWLWAWANDASNIPPDLLRAAGAMRIQGRLYDIPEFTEPELPLSEVDGHTLAIIASGLCQANAYYRAPYEGGALFLLIRDDIYPRCQESPLARIATVFPQAIAALDIPNHRLALTGHLEYHGLGSTAMGHQIVAMENGQPLLTATFDERDRLSKLDVRIGARPG